MDNPLNRSQSNTRAFKLFSPVKPLEYAKQLIDVLHLETDSIVSNENDDLIFFSIGASDLNLGLLAFAREFNSVGNEINQGESQHRTVSIQIGQCPNSPI